MRATHVPVALAAALGAACVTVNAPAPPPAVQPAPEVYYATCADARAVGAAPLYRGQPGYRPELDRDGDGVACE